MYNSRSERLAAFNRIALDLEDFSNRAQAMCMYIVCIVYYNIVRLGVESACVTLSTPASACNEWRANVYF